MDFPKSKNLENKAITCKSKADNGLFAFSIQSVVKKSIIPTRNTWSSCNINSIGRLVSRCLKMARALTYIPCGPLP